jgi:hypothetical protein
MIPWETHSFKLLRNLRFSDRIPQNFKGDKKELKNGRKVKIPPLLLYCF